MRPLPRSNTARAPPRSPCAAAAAAVAVQAYEEEAYDEASAPSKTGSRGDRGNRPGAERARVRPDPLPDGPLPGTHNRAPSRPDSSPMSSPTAPGGAAGHGVGVGGQRSPVPASAFARRRSQRPTRARCSPMRRRAAHPLGRWAPRFRPAAAAPHGVGALRSLPGRPALREPLRQPQAPPAEPAFTGAGRWSELPLPIHDDLDLPVPGRDPGRDPGRGPALDLPETSLDPASDDFGGEQGPVGALISRFIDTVRGDAYVMFIGAAAVVIVLLTILLVALKG